MEKGGAGQIYHIGDTVEITIDELVRFVGNIFEFDGRYENAPTYAGSVARRCPDISKAMNELGYAPGLIGRKAFEKP